MSDTVSRTVTHSFLGRLKNAFGGIVVGLLLFVAGFPLHFWNEGRAVKAHRSLKEGASSVISIAADRPDPTNDDRLVHLSGLATTDSILTDDELGVSENAIALRRSVEMYQWIEEKESKRKKKLGGKVEEVKTFRYEKSWSSRAVDSDEFEEPGGHQNPGTMRWQKSELVADRVQIGEFVLSSRLTAGVPGSTSRAVTSTEAASLPESAGPVHLLTDGVLFFGSNPDQPEVGDHRVRFETVGPQNVSIVARQDGNRLAAYQTSVGREIELLEPGIQPAATMFQSAMKRNSMLTWLVRLGGFLLMWIGLGMALRPFSVLADVVPAIGSLVSFGIGLATAVIAGGLSLLTIAVGWLSYRPLIGVPLLILGIALPVGLKVAANRRRSSTPPPPPPPLPPPPLPPGA